MAKFIPTSQEKADKIQEKLSKTLFQNVEKFIEYYNSGLINKRFEQTKELVDEITESFANIKEKNYKIIIIAEEEIIIEHAIDRLKYWEPIIKIKREVIKLAKTGKIRPEDKIVIAENGSISLLGKNAETGQDELRDLDTDKNLTNSDKLEKLLSLSSYGKDKNEQLDGYLFKASDILNVDTNFIKQINSIIPR